MSEDNEIRANVTLNWSNQLIFDFEQSQHCLKDKFIVFFAFVPYLFKRLLLKTTDKALQLSFLFHFTCIRTRDFFLEQSAFKKCPNDLWIRLVSDKYPVSNMFFFFA